MEPPGNGAMIMKRSQISIAVSLLFAASLAVEAGTTTISTGGVYGGPKQSQAYCYAFNPTSTKTFYFVGSAQILKQDGTEVTSSATCYPGTHAPWLGTLEPLHTCVFSAELESGTSYGCRVTFRSTPPGVSKGGAKPNVRGTMDIRDAEDNVLTSSPLR